MRPTESLEAQADMRRFARSAAALAMWRDIIRGQEQSGLTPMISRAYDRQRHEVISLGAASTFWVSREMIDIACAAAPSMPAEPLLQSDFPCECGMVFFERSIPFEGGSNDMGVDAAVDMQPFLSAFRWRTQSLALEHRRQDSNWMHDKVTVAEFTSYEDTDDPKSWFRARRTKAAWAALPRFSPFYNDFEIVAAPHLTEHEQAMLSARAGSRIPVLQTMRAVISLLGQTIVVDTPTRPERATRKRVAKMEPDLADKMIRVVTLRRIKPPSEDELAGQAATPIHPDWSHRWLVQGHWRRQWHPSKQEHRLRWIHEFIKGPEDKPLIPKLTINKLRR